MGDQCRSYKDKRLKMGATTQTNLENDVGFTERAAGPCVFVLFGAAGDLTKRKLAPALFNLGKAKLLSDNFAVISVSVDDLSQEDFRTQVTSFLPAGADSAEALEWFRKRLFYERGDFADQTTFAKLRERLAAIDAEQHTEGNYLSIWRPHPSFFRRLWSSWERPRFPLKRMDSGGGWSLKSPSGRIWTRLRC